MSITVQRWDPTLPVAILAPTPEGPAAVVLQPVECVARDFVRLMMAQDARRARKDASSGLRL